MTHVLVLHARLRSAEMTETLSKLLEGLPYAKRLELERRDIRGRHASLAGISLVLAGAAILRGSSIDVGSLRFPADGKPCCVGGPHFSISHGAERAAAALSVDAGIGLDLEEVGATERNARNPRATLERWTATEAVLKAAGRGLRDARAVELDESLETGRVSGETFQLKPVTIAANVVAHIASPTAIEAIVVEEIDLPV